MPEALEEEWEDYRDKRLSRAYNGMPEDWKRARREEFVEKIKEGAREGQGGVLYERYRKTGFESPIVMANFLASLRDELLSRPEEKSFESYLEYRKVELPVE